jgi:steroid 5-alpha reductase family enzyme
VNYLQVFGASALAIAVLMVGTWVVSLVLKNASIVDIVWGAGFVLVAWVSYAIGDGTESRRLLLGRPADGPPVHPQPREG